MATNCSQLHEVNNSLQEFKQFGTWISIIHWNMPSHKRVKTCGAVFFLLLEGSFW